MLQKMQRKRKSKAAFPPGTHINVQEASLSSKKDIHPQTYDSAGIDAFHMHHAFEERLAFCVDLREGHCTHMSRINERENQVPIIRKRELQVPTED